MDRKHEQSYEALGPLEARLPIRGVNTIKKKKLVVSEERQ